MLHSQILSFQQVEGENKKIFETHPVILGEVAKFITSRAEICSRFLAATLSTGILLGEDQKKSTHDRFSYTGAMSMVM